MIGVTLLYTEFDHWTDSISKPNRFTIGPTITVALRPLRITCGVVLQISWIIYASDRIWIRPQSSDNIHLFCWGWTPPERLCPGWERVFELSIDSIGVSEFDWILRFPQMPNTEWGRATWQLDGEGIWLNTQGLAEFGFWKYRGMKKTNFVSKGVWSVLRKIILSTVIYTPITISLDRNGKTLY